MPIEQISVGIAFVGLKILRPHKMMRRVASLVECEAMIGQGRGSYHC